ncbi:MAG: GYF domain-containing protein [Verrucomicrobiales bacterium]|jgi:uncharacterized membrane protein|nr:GYF domain-containing protein [Verrucomicrobiales bacterium]
MKQWYYAKDGQKFGPFQKSRVLELYQKSEIAPGDLVWEEGTADWITAEQAFGPLTASSDTPPPIPATTSLEGQKFDPIDCIQRAWDLIWKQPAYLIGGCFLAVIMASVTQVPMQIGSHMMGLVKLQGWHSPIVISGIVLYVAGFLLSFVVNPLVYGGLFWMILRIVRGNQPDFADLFIAFKNFKLALTLILAGLAVSAIVVLGLIALIIPGIYLAVAYSFVTVLVVDRKLRVWEALELSRKVVTTKWWPVFALGLLNCLIVLLGMLACCVGLLVAIPLCYTSILYAYEILFHNEKGNQ